LSGRDSWLEAEFEKIFVRDPTKHHEFNFYMEYCRLLLANAQLALQVQIHQLRWIGRNKTIIS